MVALVGVLLNPIAGFGGAFAMHGTDDLPASRFDEAVRAGRAGRRLVRALQRFGSAGADARFAAAPGLLGGAQLGEAGIRYQALQVPEASAPTTRDDTVEAARKLVAQGIDVLMFCGGDGTATDIAEAVGTTVPVVGVPAGVKMHSEVFARSPERAGRLLADVVAGHANAEIAEVLDAGADGVPGVVGLLLAPRSREVLQGAKAATPAPASSAAGTAIAHDLVADASRDTTWVIGPGRTAGAVADALGFTPTLRGVDVRHPSGSIEPDVTEARLHRIVSEAAGPRLVLGVVGGQGFLLGRGNQQLSARVIERIGVERIDIVATPGKVDGLFPPVLFVDADEAGAPLLGYRSVRTGVRQRRVMKVVE